MYLQEIKGILPGFFIKIKYDCIGQYEKCGKEHSLKLKDAEKNYTKNNSKHICRQCTLKLNNPMYKKENVVKVQNTNKDKYGTTLAMNTKENIAKRVDKMFGTQKAIDDRNEKTKKTMNEKYGADHIMKTEEGIKRLTNTMQEKYGVDYPLQSEIIMNRMNETVKERYNVDNVMQLPEVQEKVKETMVDRYGVEFYNQLPEMKEYLKENCKIWLADSYANPWAKGITRPEEWKQKQRETVINLVLEGKWLGGYSKGKIQGWITHPNNKCKREKSYFRSYLELFTHIYLNENKDVEWYDFEPFAIEYIKENSTHKYVVDFMIKFSTESEIHLVETKPRFKISDPVVQSKGLAAQKFAEVEGFIYEYYDEYFVNSFGYKLNDILKLPYIEMREK